MNKFSILLIIFFIILFILSNYLRSSYSQSIPCDKKNIIKILFRQCARWSTASTQDLNPIIANLHANYAAGYLWALEDLFTTDDITSATQIDYKKFRMEIQKNQDLTTRKLIMACPKYAEYIANTSKLIARIAGEA